MTHDVPQIINGYEHFSAETCTIFDDAEVQRWRIMEQDGVCCCCCGPCGGWL